MKLKDLIPIFLSFLSFLLVFNFFHTVVPTFIPFTVEDVYRYSPDAYSRFDDKPDRIIVKISQVGDVIAIEYWYHWGYDGFEKRDDYEPVIVYVKDGEVYAVAVRIHYQWRVNFNPTLNGSHAVITFAYLWHTPLFMNPPEGWVKIDDRFEFGKAPEVIDHLEIVGRYSINSAVLFGIIAGISTYLISREIII